MRFRDVHHRCILAMLMMTAAIVLGGCASEPESPFADFASPHSENVGVGIGSTLRIHQAFDRMNRQKHPSISTRDDDGNFFASAMRIVDVQDQAKRLPPHLLGQILWLGKTDLSSASEVAVYADGFEQIEMLFWHDGILHVMHGPNYSTVTGIPGEPAKAKRDDRSKVISAKTHTASQSENEMKTLQGVLADRTKSNEVRIEALWKLRDLTNDRSASDSCFGFSRTPVATPAEWDPTKSFITAMHNGPEPLRAEAARALRMRTVDTRPAIKGLIHRAKNDTSAKVRMEAALTLGYLKAKDAAGDLLGSLDDPDDAARIAKVLAIRMIDKWELAPAFMNAASERTREGALLALRDVQKAGAIAALDFAVRASPYPEIRLQAVKLLGRATYEMKLIDTSFMGTIHDAAMEASDPKLKDFSFPTWYSAKVPSPLLPQIVESLRAATMDEDASVRSEAAICLSKAEAMTAPK